jgi:hypothetical protein
MRKLAVFFPLCLLGAAPAHAVGVHVNVIGTVEENNIGINPLDEVMVGDTVVLSFTVDSTVFTDGDAGGNATRGYTITDFLGWFGGVPVGLASPGGPAYFTLCAACPASDDIWLSSSPDSPGGAPIDFPGGYNLNVDVAYTGDFLGSNDILDAPELFDDTGLQRSAFTIWSGSPDLAAMTMVYEGMTIQAKPSPVPLPGAVWLLISGIAGIRMFPRRSKA